MTKKRPDRSTNHLREDAHSTGAHSVLVGAGVPKDKQLVAHALGVRVAAHIPDIETPIQFRWTGASHRKLTARRPGWHTPLFLRAFASSCPGRAPFKTGQSVATLASNFQESYDHKDQLSAEILC